MPDEAFRRARRPPVLIGIAGGTSSGKTSFAQAVAMRLGHERTVLISQDSYYFDPSHLPFEERARINYDHPDAYETELLLEHLAALRRRRSVPKLAYDYVEHARVERGERIEPKDIVIVEGNLALAVESLRGCYDIKLFIDTDSDIRVLRRITRDIEARGRTLESVARQYVDSVRPMHLQFVEPSKRYADLIVPEGAHNEVALHLVVARILELVTGA